jgi:hypothetical protein
MKIALLKAGKTKVVKGKKKVNKKPVKATIPDKHRLTPEEIRDLQQSEKDLAEGRYTVFSSPKDLIAAIKNDSL